VRRNYAQQRTNARPQKKKKQKRKELVINKNSKLATKTVFFPKEM